MMTVGLIVVAAAIALGIAIRTGLPANVLAIVSGIALQSVSIPLDDDVVRDGLLLAATFLVFGVGAEIERRPLKPYRRAALGLTVLTVLVNAAAGLLLWAVLDIDAWTAVYWVVAFGASSTLLAVEHLRRRERLFEPIGRIISATVLLQDLLVVLAIVAATALGQEPAHAVAIVAGAAGLALTGWILGEWIAPKALLRVGLDEEERLLFILLVLFGFCAAARWTGGALVTGAFFAGKALSRFPVGDLARGYLRSFSDFFTVLFYVMLGLVVTVPVFSGAIAEVIFVAVLVLVRPLVLLPLLRNALPTVRASVEAVTLMANAGELAVIVAIVGIELGHLAEPMLGSFAAVVVITMAITPWLSSDRVTWKVTHWYPFQRSTSLPVELTNHVVLLGCGEAGSVVLNALRGNGVDIVVVDDDPAVVASLERQGIPTLRGDGADPDILQAARAGHARAVVSTMRRAADNARLLSALAGIKVLVRVFSEEEAEPIRERGGHPIVEAEVAADAMLRWCERVMSANEVRDAPMR